MDNETKKMLGVGLLVFAAIKIMEPPRYVAPPPKPTGNLQNNYAAWLAYANSVTASALKLYGSIEAAIKTLWGPGGPFENTPVPQYDAGSIFWQDIENGKVAGIGKIYKLGESGDIPTHPCVDRTHASYPYRPGMCAWHGGVDYSRLNNQAAQRAYHKRMQRLRAQNQ